MSDRKMSPRDEMVIAAPGGCLTSSRGDMTAQRAHATPKAPGECDIESLTRFRQSS